MLRRLLGLVTGRPRKQLVLPPELERRMVAHLLFDREGFPHVDWGMAASWIANQTHDPERSGGLKRGVAAAWLEAVRGVLPEDYRRWRHARVEGLAPHHRGVADVAARAADHAIEVIEEALRPILDSERMEPIAVVVLGSVEDYISFTSPFYGEEGAFGTSGGVYIRSDGDSFPFIAVPAPRSHSLAATIAHELTHHALVDHQLPLWVEEGLTQMMEERATGVGSFMLSRELVERHWDRWSNMGLASFWDGTGFGSPHDDEQELSYHLAQILVRGQLERDSAAFFRFVGACRSIGPDEAVRRHLGDDPDEAVLGFLDRAREE